MLQFLVSVSLLHQQLHSTCADPCHTSAFKLQQSNSSHSRRIPLQTTVHKLKAKVYNATRYEVSGDGAYSFLPHKKAKARAHAAALTCACIVHTTSADSSGNPLHDSFHLSTVATFLSADEQTGQARDARCPWNVPLTVAAPARDEAAVQNSPVHSGHTRPSSSTLLILQE